MLSLCEPDVSGFRVHKRLAQIRAGPREFLLLEPPLTRQATRKKGETIIKSTQRKADDTSSTVLMSNFSARAELPESALSAASAMTWALPSQLGSRAALRRKIGRAVREHHQVYLSVPQVSPPVPHPALVSPLLDPRSLVPV